MFFDVLLLIEGSEPEVSNLYTTKSGSKRVFQGAKVAMPYGEFDIYNKVTVIQKGNSDVFS